MSDLLVRLYALPPRPPTELADGTSIRRALGPEKGVVSAWIARTFNTHWASECEMAFGGQPVSCWIAVRDSKLLGFACHDGTARGFFGPTGVDPEERGKGIGDALLMNTLWGMREAGYGYAIIGDPGPVAFYTKRLDAIEIPNSKPGVYAGLLPRI